MTLYVYILASKPQGTLYVGITNDLVRRVYEHKHDLIEGFTKRYQVHTLVWFEAFDDYNEAIAREKRLKRWHRDWKRTLIEEATLIGLISIQISFAWNDPWHQASALEPTTSQG